MTSKEWNQHIAEHAPPFGAFLQSWEWGEFQESLGRRVVRIFEENTDGVLLVQAVRMDMPLGQFYWYAPKGPLGTMKPEAMAATLRAKLEAGMFFRIEPSQEPRLMKVKDVQPADTALVDLHRNEEDLVQSFKSKTRYNMRLAERKGVESRMVGMEHVEDFLRLLDQTTARDEFRAHPADYYRAMLESMREGGAQAHLAMAFYEGRPLAGNIVVDFAGMRTYMHGATSNLHRNVMAQYHLHAFLMLDARRKGLDTFDFWGVAPEGASDDHPWAGITRYKLGYGGTIASMPGTYDLPVNHVWYAAYRAMRKIRRS